MSLFEMKKVEKARVEMTQYVWKPLRLNCVIYQCTLHKVQCTVDDDFFCKIILVIRVTVSRKDTFKCEYPKA